MQLEQKFVPRQILLLYMVTVMGTANFYISAIAAEEVGHDAWLSIIVTVLPAFLIIFLTSKLALRYPRVSFVDFIERLLGKFLARALACLYLFFIFVTNAAIVREFNTFIKMTILPETPDQAIIVAMLASIAYLLTKDLSTLGKIVDILGVIFLLSFVFIFLLLFDKFAFTSLLPILENRPIEIIKSGIIPISWTGEVVLIVLFFLPFTTNLKKSVQKLYLGEIGIAFFKILMVIALIVVSEEDQKFRLPVFSVATMIDVAHFIHNLDAVVLIAWVLGIFVKVAVFQVALLLLLKDVLHFKSYKFLILPSFLVIYSMTLYMFTGIDQLTGFITKIWPYFAFTFELVIPSLLLCISLVRGVDNGNSNNNFYNVSDNVVRDATTN